MFDVTPDFELRMLRITLRGFWTAETFASYMPVVRRARGELERSGGCRSILIDMVDFPIQAKEIAQAHAENLRLVRQTSDARVALVLQGALSKLQAARVASDTGYPAFRTKGEAMAWLLSKES
jgi:hypothetical protein